MYDQRPGPGVCPNCDTGIGPASVLIEYESDDGERAVFAACPGCGEVVHPI